LSSNAVPFVRYLLRGCAAAVILAPPLTAQDDTSVTQTAATPSTRAAPTDLNAGTDANNDPPDDDLPPLINLSITVPRGDVSAAQIKACEDRADAGQISGEIVVCRQLGEDPANLYSSREEARKRFADETKYKGDAPPPSFIETCRDKGNPFNCVGFGSAPPPALLIDVGALPEAPEGSDADRIANGLPPLGQDGPSEEEIRQRRKALGLSAPPIEQDPE